MDKYIKCPRHLMKSYTFNLSVKTRTHFLPCMIVIFFFSIVIQQKKQTMSGKKSKKRSIELPSELQNKHKKPLQAVIKAFVEGKLTTTQVSKCLKNAAKAIDEPKKPRKANASILFANENREMAVSELNKLNKKITPQLVSKHLEAKWKGLPVEKKQTYKDRISSKKATLQDYVVETKKKV